MSASKHGRTVGASVCAQMGRTSRMIGLESPRLSTSVFRKLFLRDLVYTYTVWGVAQCSDVACNTL